MSKFGTNPASGTSLVHLKKLDDIFIGPEYDQAISGFVTNCFLDLINETLTD